MEPVIEVRGLEVDFGALSVLKGIELEVRAGEMVAVIGPNGSGKTTLLNAVTGLVRPTRGRIVIMGRDGEGLGERERARLVAVVPQAWGRDFPFTCKGVVLMGRYPHLGLLGGYGVRDHAIAARAMEQTCVPHLSGRPFDQVSGGEAQSVIIARALAQETPVLLLDEGTSGLDLARKMRILDLLALLNRKGKTVVAVIHDLNLAALYFNRLVFLKKGEVAVDGPTNGVFTAENIVDVFGAPVAVGRHPATGAPQAYPLPGNNRGAAGCLEES